MSRQITLARDAGAIVEARAPAGLLLAVSRCCAAEASACLQKVAYSKFHLRLWRRCSCSTHDLPRHASVVGWDLLTCRCWRA